VRHFLLSWSLLAASCAAGASSSPAVAPAMAMLEREQGVPMTHPQTGEVGVWMHEDDFGELLAAVILEKGDLKTKIAEEQVARAFAEAEANALRKGLGSASFWATWGLPIGLAMGAVIATAVAFVGVWLGDELKRFTPANYSVDFTAGDYGLRIAW
jgi:hypothetical protein